MAMGFFSVPWVSDRGSGNLWFPLLRAGKCRRHVWHRRWSMCMATDGNQSSSVWNRLRFMNSSVSDFNGRLITRKCLFVSNSMIDDRYFTPKWCFVSNSMNDDWIFTLESLFVSNSTVFDEIFTPRFRFVSDLMMLLSNVVLWVVFGSVFLFFWVFWAFWVLFVFCLAYLGMGGSEIRSWGLTHEVSTGGLEKEKTKPNQAGPLLLVVSKRGNSPGMSSEFGFPSF